MFELHPQLEKDTQLVAEWPLCRVLLMNDRRFPWFILVPRLPGLRELHEVPAGEKAQLQKEMDRASLSLQQATGAHKMNVAALGNMVPQLHIHVIARFDGDDAWPKPVWGVGTGEAYSDLAAAQVIEQFAQTDAGLHPEG